ncbi:hypothetical protein ABPG72_021052 [Tetrahymena utriculariae]
MLIQQIQDNHSYCQDITLSEEQKKIIYSNIEEDQRILACAGSGKTTTLIYRIKYLIEKGIEANQILLSTFNVEAAKNLKIKANLVLKGQEKNVKIVNIDKFTSGIYERFIKDKTKDNEFRLDVKEFGYQAKEYLSTKEGQKNVLMKYKYFFFDEFQDVNQIQYDIIILFKKMGCKIVVIGDEAQNIYGFRDSKLEFIQSKIVNDVLEISKQNIKTYSLKTNFRCSSQITQFCNQIFANQQDFVQRQMQSFKQDQNKSVPKIYLYNNKDEQVEDIMIQLQNLKHQYEWSDLAILSPTRKPLRHFQEILEKHNSNPEKNQIPYSLRFKNTDNFLFDENFEFGEKQNNLTLSTIHASKGLEWKIVFIIGINDQNFPGTFINKLNEEDNQEKLSECRRFFYVACTRAMEQLNFSFIKQTKNYICRFFSEINEKYYCSQQGFNKQAIVQIKPKNSKVEFQSYKNNIADIIQNFDQSDYEVVNSFLQQIQFDSYKTGRKATYKDIQIKQNNLQQDLICYLDVLLYRSIAERFQKPKKFTNEDAEKILVTINWNGQSKTIYNKYIQFFNNKNLDFKKLESPELFIGNLNDYYKNDKQVDQKEIKILQQMYQNIKLFLKNNNLQYKDIFHATESRTFDYFPEDFQDKQKYVDSYLKFSDQSQNTQNILEDIYNVSKCNLISQGIRRSLYRDDKLIIINNYDLKFNIFRFLKSLQSQSYEKYEIKKKVEYEELNGIIDLVAYKKGQGDIFQFVYQIGSKPQLNISKHQIIQSLVYAEILKKNGKSIKNIIFYNVLKEDQMIYSIEAWNQEQKFLNFLQKKKIDYIKKQEENQETDNNLEEEDQQEIKVMEYDQYNQYMLLEEAKEDNSLNKIFKNNLQENEERHIGELYQQQNCPYTRQSTQNLSQNTDEAIQKKGIQYMQNINVLNENLEIENQTIPYQIELNEHLTPLAIDGQQINQNELFAQQSHFINNIQQNGDDSKKVEDIPNQKTNLKDTIDQNSQTSVNDNNKKFKKSENENLTPLTINDQKINQKEQLAQQNYQINNIQQNGDDSKKIRDSPKQQINLNYIIDENSQTSVNNYKKKLKKSNIENEMSNLNQKRKKEKNELEYNQQKINYKKQKVELQEKAINVQIIFFIIFIVFQILQMSLQYKAINS